MRVIKRVFWGAVLVLATTFAFINLQTVEVHLDPLGLGFEAMQTVRTPLAFVILASVALGLILGWALSVDATWQTGRALNAEKRTAKKLKLENEKMMAAMKAADHPDSAAPPARR